MEHANESTEKQQDDAVNLQVVFTNWECNFFLQLNETSLLVIEACAGTAILSSVYKDIGFEVLPIDFGKQKNSSHLHIIPPKQITLVEGNR